MKNKLQLLLLVVFIGFNALAQTTNPWSASNGRELNLANDRKDRTFPPTSLYYRLDLQSLTTTLMGASDILTKGKDVIISIPNMKGELESYKVWEFSNFAPELQAAYPRIRSYRGKGITDPSANLSISMSPNGIQTMTLRADKTSEFIEPCTYDGTTYYALFNKTERKDSDKSFSCFTKEEQELASEYSSFGKEIQNQSTSNAQILRIFRLALSCTGEYTQYFGGTKEGALAAMNNTMTRVNGIYEVEIGTHLDLIANNDILIYLNPATDPYSDSSTGSNGAWNTELQNNLNKTLGGYPNSNYVSIANDKYDIGHLFGASGGGGNAGCIGCVCVNAPAQVNSLSQSKGMAYTSPSDAKPEGDTYDIDYVCHEMGHQLGAEHTYTYKLESGNTQQVEPGSGSTIMGYAGITSYDIQKHTDPYFNYRSLSQIQNNLANKTCGTTTTLTNNPPTINAGNNYTIPYSTPFVLIGTGQDTDLDDIITYCWEQDDNITTNSATGDNSFCSASKTEGPNFRSVKPSVSPVRYFPNLNTILTSNSFIPRVTSYEALLNNTGARTLNFQLTGRDNQIGGGQTNSSKMSVTVDGAKGPFFVNSQSESGIAWAPNSTQTITWNVASANLLPGSENVDILLSTDNGLTYTTTLLTNTPNDGSAEIMVPDISATNCRIMVKPTNNIFFSINKTSFAIGYNVTTNCTSYKNQTVTSIPSGGATFSTSTNTVTDSGKIYNASVSINTTHPNFADMTFILVSPTGTEIKLVSAVCYGNSTSNTTNIRFIDSGKVIKCASTITSQDVLPVEPLYKLIGENAQGVWILKFIDDATSPTSATKTLNSWTLNLCIQNSTVLGTEDFKLNNLSLYPNPTNNIINISVPDESNLPENLVVYNSVGQMVYSTKINSTADLTFSSSKFADGVYFVKVNKGSASATLKFIKN